MFENIGGTELIIVLLVLVFFFGTSKLTEFAKNAGAASKELKKVKRDYDDALVDLRKPPEPDKPKASRKKATPKKAEMS